MSDEAKELGRIEVVFYADSYSVNITGAVGPMNLWGAAELITLEGQAMYAAERMAQQQRGSGIVAARTLPGKARQQ